MRPYKFISVLAFLTASAHADDAGKLTTAATGFRNTDGHAVAKLFAPGDNVLGPGHWQVSAPIVAGQATLHFENLSSGSYAVVVFHDENDNGVLDHGLLGPAEPLGFSGGFSLGLLSGLPSFDKLKFDYQPPAQVITVRVK